MFSSLLLLCDAQNSRFSHKNNNNKPQILKHCIYIVAQKVKQSTTFLKGEKEELEKRGEVRGPLDLVEVDSF